MTRPMLTVLASLLLLAAPLRGQSPGPVAFVGVDVITMSDAGTLADHTVLVRNGVIQTVGPVGQVAVPDDATVIDASGKTLIPGLAEMHAHIPQGQNQQALVEEIMFLYIANGVTTIRGMLGAPSQFAFRDATASGALLGPTMFLAAPSLRAQTVPDAATAERLVRQHAAAGYDLLKIHPGVPLDAWDRMVEVASEVGITFGGHVPAAVGIRHALETGMSTVDHLDGYLEGALNAALQARVDRGDTPTWDEIVLGIDEGKMLELARLSAASGVWQVPTSYLWYNLYAPSAPDEMLALPEMQYVSAQQRQAWVQSGSGGRMSPEGAIRLREIRGRFLKAIHDAGGGIMMGTDTPQLFNVAGFSLMHEIRYMAEAGLPAEAILAAGTRNVAEYARTELRDEGSFGSIVAGNRADLVLLDGDPLTDIANIERRAGVMVRGRWVPADEIEAGLARIAARYSG